MSKASDRAPLTASELYVLPWQINNSPHSLFLSCVLCVCVYACFIYTAVLSMSDKVKLFL